jgi:hypothetical protein
MEFALKGAAKLPKPAQRIAAARRFQVRNRPQVLHNKKWACFLVNIRPGANNLGWIFYFPE